MKNRRTLEHLAMTLAVVGLLISVNAVMFPKNNENLIITESSPASQKEAAVPSTDAIDPDYEAEPYLFINDRTAVQIVGKDFVGAPAFARGTKLKFEVSDDISHNLTDKHYYYSTTGSGPWTKIDADGSSKLQPGNYYISASYCANGHRVETSDYRIFGFTILDGSAENSSVPLGNG